MTTVLPFGPTSTNEAPAPLVSARVCGTEHQYVEWTMEPQDTVMLEHGAFLAAQGTFQLSARTAIAPTSSWWGVLLAPLRWAYYSASKKASGERLWSEVITAVDPTVLFASNPNGGQVERVFLDGDGDVLSLRRGAWIGHAGELTVSASLAGSLMPMFMACAPIIWQTVRGLGDVYFGAHGRLHTVALTPGRSLYVDAKALVGWHGAIEWRSHVVRDVRGALFAGEGFALLEGTGHGEVWIDTTDPPATRLPMPVPASPTTR